MANNAVIGILKALLTAETGEYTAAMRAAGAEAQALGKKLEKDLEPRQRSINNLVAQFLGGTEIRRAQEYAAAIEKVGGVTALTASDQLKANRAVSEALEHYRKLGIEAPKNLRDIEAATKQVPKAMDGIGASAMKMASALGLAFSAAAVVNGIKNLVRDAFEAAGKIDDLSLKLGISAEAVQRFSFAAKQTGSDIEGIGTAISKMNANLSGGSKDVVSMLKQLGLSFSDIRSMKPEDAFVAISEAIKKIPDPMLQAEAALKLFGKSGQDLLPLMKQGITDLMSQTAVMSDDTIKRLDAAGDAWQKFGDEVTIVTGEIIADMFSAGEGFTTFFSHLAATAKGFFSGGVLGGNQASAKFLEDLGAANRQLANAKAHAADLDRLQAALPKAIMGDPAQAAEAKRKLDAYIKSVKDMADEWNGATLAAKVELTAKAFDRLTAAQLADERVMVRVTKDVVALAKAGADLPPKLDEIARKSQAMTAAQDLAAKVSTTLTKAFLDQRSAVLPHVKTVAELTAEFNKFIPSADQAAKMIANVGKEAKLAEAPAMKLGDALIHGLTGPGGFTEKLGPTILDAVTGGGDVGRAIGTLFGQTIGETLAKSLSKSIGGSIGGAIGSILPGIGAGLGSMFGDLFSNLFGKGKGRQAIEDWAATFDKSMRDNKSGFDDLHDMLLTLGDEGERLWRNLGNGTKRDTEAAQRAMDAITEALQEMDDAMGRAGLTSDDLGGSTDKVARSAQQLARDFSLLTTRGFSLEQITKGNADALNKLIGAALETGQKIPAALQPMIAQLAKSGLLTDDLKRKLLGLDAEVPWEEMESVATKYGIALEALGPRFLSAKLGSTAEAFAKEFMLLVDNGADVGAVIDGMGEKANEFLLNAKKWGVELPASMKPLLEKMIEAGRLVDENGNKIETLEGMQFGKTMAEQLEPLLAKLDELIEVLTKGVPGALNTMVDEAEKSARRWPTFGRPSVPDGFGTGDGESDNSFRHGTGGFKNFGKGTSATLHGWEQVINTDEAQGIAGMVHQAVTTASPTGPITMVWRVNGRDLYRETFPDLVAVLRNAQVTR